MTPRYAKDLLVVHHSLTKDGVTVSWSAIRRFHTSWRHGDQAVTAAEAAALKAAGKRVEPPWEDNGYNLGVEFVSEHYELLAGRPLSAKAAACPQFNANERGIHVCFVGNYDEIPPPEAMLRFAAPHLAHVCGLAGIVTDSTHVIGHRDLNPAKSCPGTQFSVGRLIALMQEA